MSLSRSELVRRFFLAMSAALLLTGCGEGTGPDTAPVAGKVTIGGQPVAGVEVHFLNTAHPNHNALGVTDGEGDFKIVQGAVVGANTVYFSKIEGDGLVADPEAGMDAGQMEAAAAASNRRAAKVGPRQVVPEEYASAASKLTFEVPADGSTSASFDL